jgi:hypothetical protein
MCPAVAGNATPKQVCALPKAGAALRVSPPPCGERWGGVFIFMDKKGGQTCNRIT